MFENEVDTQIYRSESHFVYFFCISVLYFFELYTLCLLYLVFGSLLILEEAEEIDAEAFNLDSKIQDYLEIDDFELFELRKDESFGLGSILEDMLSGVSDEALLDKNVELDDIFMADCMSPSEERLMFRYKNRSGYIHKLGKHRLRKHMITVYNRAIEMRSSDEEITQAKNIIKYRVFEKDLYSKETKREVSKQYATFSPLKRQVIRLMRFQIVVNLYIFNTIIYSGIYPSSNSDFELFLVNHVDKQEYKFLLIGNNNINGNYDLYEPKNLRYSKKSELEIWNKSYNVKIINEKISKNQ